MGSLSLASACSSSDNSTATYVPPTSPPPTLTLAEGASVVATDRKYSIDHIWVKSLSGNRVVLGITDKMQRLTSMITDMQLPLREGDDIRKDLNFGYLGALKLDADLISPVTGTVLQTNTYLTYNASAVNTDPYGQGWLHVVKLSKPEELKDLMTPQEYANLQSQVTGARYQ